MDGCSRLKDRIGLRHAIAIAIALAVRSAGAADPFEIQVYDGSANAPGIPGLELHANRVWNGTKTAPAPELPMHRQTHLTLEPALGITPFFEIGGYFQTAFRGDGTFDYAGSKLRTKFILPRAPEQHLRLGLNIELALLPERYDRSRWGGELRPIVAWENERWLFAANPNFGLSFAPPDGREGPSFEPAVMAKIKIAGVVAAGFEHYADFGPIADPSPWDEQEHYLYEAIDFISIPRLEINAGIGAGLTGASSALVTKLILGYSWDRAVDDSPRNVQ